MMPPNRFKEKLPPVGPELQPAVGVSITLRKEEVSIKLFNLFPSTRC